MDEEESEDRGGDDDDEEKERKRGGTEEGGRGRKWRVGVVETGRYTTGKVSSNSKAVESRKNRRNEDIR